MTRTNTRQKKPLELVPAPSPAPLSLDIACGQNKQPGFVGIDNVPGEQVDIVHDLQTYPWPLADASVGVAFCSHYIEHIPLDFIAHQGNPRKDALEAFFDEVERILVPGGQITIVAPYYASMRCWQDPTHRRAISEATFLYVNRGWREQNKLDHYHGTCDFDFSYAYVLDAMWAGRAEEARAFAMRHYINVINDIQVTLTKRQG